VPRVFKFLDILGSELHTIDDPEEKLPVPQTGQVISIELSTMLVQSVLLERTGVYSVQVRKLSAGKDQLFKN
jgi:hypothetical protein